MYPLVIAPSSLDEEVICLFSKRKQDGGREGVGGREWEGGERGGSGREERGEGEGREREGRGREGEGEGEGCYKGYTHAVGVTN